MTTRYFEACPRCGSQKKGRTIYQCRKCATYYCLEARWFSTSGCGKDGLCPECRAKTSDGSNRNRVVGYIQ